MAGRVIKKYLACIFMSLALVACASRQPIAPIVIDRQVEPRLYPSKSLLDLCLIDARITAKDVPANPQKTNYTQLASYIVKLENSYTVCRDVVFQIEKATPEK